MTKFTARIEAPEAVVEVVLRAFVGSSAQASPPVWVEFVNEPEKIIVSSNTLEALVRVCEIFSSKGYRITIFDMDEAGSSWAARFVGIVVALSLAVLVVRMSSEEWFERWSYQISMSLLVGWIFVAVVGFLKLWFYGVRSYRGMHHHHQHHHHDKTH